MYTWKYSNQLDNPVHFRKVFGEASTVRPYTLCHQLYFCPYLNGWNTCRHEEAKRYSQEMRFTSKFQQNIDVWTTFAEYFEPEARTCRVWDDMKLQHASATSSKDVKLDCHIMQYVKDGFKLQRTHLRCLQLHKPKFTYISILTRC